MSLMCVEKKKRVLKFHVSRIRSLHTRLWINAIDRLFFMPQMLLSSKILMDLYIGLSFTRGISKETFILKVYISSKTRIVRDTLFAGHPRTSKRSYTMWPFSIPKPIFHFCCWNLFCCFRKLFPLLLSCFVFPFNYLIYIFLWRDLVTLPRLRTISQDLVSRLPLPLDVTLLLPQKLLKWVFPCGFSFTSALSPLYPEILPFSAPLPVSPNRLLGDESFPPPHPLGCSLSLPLLCWGHSLGCNWATFSLCGKKYFSDFSALCWHHWQLQNSFHTVKPFATVELLDHAHVPQRKSCQQSLILLLVSRCLQCGCQFPSCTDKICRNIYSIKAIISPFAATNHVILVHCRHNFQFFMLFLNIAFQYH